MYQPLNPSEAERFKPITRANVEKTPYWRRLSPALQEAVRVVSAVLPFRSNEYVARELIDWDRVPHDPMFQLTFPQKGMLREDNYETIARLVRADAPADAIENAAERIRGQLNPHPAGQMTHNVPRHRGEPVAGVQHKYRETCLFFPSNGQTCHAYCTFCFRWAQFVGDDDLKFASHEVETLVQYLREHRWVTDVLFTGGDPMIMGTKTLRRYLEALLHPDLEHVQTIRIGTKAVGYWPQRFVTDHDADELMRLFEEVVAAGRHLALMGHYSHPTELSTDIAQAAVRRIRSTGANIRMQSPLIRHVNDDATAWADLWRSGVRLGAIPYYMFVERDTGARRYFEVPLVKAWEIYRKAYSRVSGLARTVRGPSMSAFPGKVHVLGVTEIGDERVFVLEYLQARDPSLVRQPFFARFDPTASWFDQLEPFSERDQSFFPRLDGMDADDDEVGDFNFVPLGFAPGMSVSDQN
ncbi:MAG TPA: lysine 2,3-aminomutase [Phycisphaerae bacterium]|nr:lysine 2,3-aminomutase [Phycisphaerae bacterium]